ncbi:hypothetical protein [Streptomyces sp. AcH 505]|uniref:hypothetical protein n=1 Tax=Streptomyces sp. AcH 505 TaxID=352211 RepID=UPI000A9ABF37
MTETTLVTQPRAWHDIAPIDAVQLNLTTDLTITAPLNELGERCRWPWEPQQLVDAPLGQYRCGYCNAMCVAGMPHLDYAPEERLVTPDNVRELFAWCEASRLRYRCRPGGRTVDGRLLELEGLTVWVAGGPAPARFGDTIIRDGFGDYTVRATSKGA